MADITMCANKTCKVSYKCYRQTATPDSRYQSMGLFEPNDRGVCEGFWYNGAAERLISILPGIRTSYFQVLFNSDAEIN